MKKCCVLLFILFLTLIVQGQDTLNQNEIIRLKYFKAKFPDLDSMYTIGDTTYLKFNDQVGVIRFVLNDKSLLSIFLEEATFKDNIIADSTLKLKKGFKDENTGAKIDSFKFSSNYDFLKIYLSGYGSEDTLSFFSSSGDSLEIWVKDMLFKAPKNLPLVTEGSKKYIQLPHEGREFYVDAIDGTNNPDSFSTSGVKDLWYASHLINADSTGTNLISHGQIEDSLLTAADWTFASNYKWSMPNDVMTGYYHPNSTKSLNLTSSNPTTSKPFSMTTYLHLGSGKSYSWEYLLKQTGTLALAKIIISDSALADDLDPNTKYTYYEMDSSNSVFDWTKFGGGLGDTIATIFEVIAYREDRHLDWGETVNHWTGAGNHTLSAEGDIYYKQYYSGKVVSTGMGDSISNYVSLSTGFSQLLPDTTYTLTGYFFKDEDVTAVGDSVTMKFGEFDTTFALTGLWTERSITFTASAWTYANAELQIWANKATIFYIDQFSIIYDGGDRTAKIVIQGNSIQNAGNMYIDNFIIQELVDTSLGWLQGGDAIILSGDFANDSLYLDGKYVKGESYLPITITSKVEGSRILGNWNLTNGIALQNHIYGVAVSDIYIEKCNRSGLIMVSEEGGLIYGRISRMRIDSTGYWDRTLGIASPPSVTGSYMGIDVRGQYTWIYNNVVTNTGNDIISIYGIHHWVEGNYCTGAYNAGNGDGFQFKQSGYMTITNNEIYSLRYLKMLAGEIIPDTLGSGAYDNKSGILCNQQGGVGSDSNEVSYNGVHGFSNSLAGNVRYSNVHHNYLTDPKYNILSGSIGGGTGVSMIGVGCNVYDNIIIDAPIGLLLKDYADSLDVSNNSFVNFIDKGIYVKKATDTNVDINWYNNLLYTDSTGSTIIDVHNSYSPTVWNYNLYYSPENTLDFHDQTTLAEIQGLGYDLNSLNANPLLEYTFRLNYKSPAIDAGTNGFTSTDYFDNAAKTNSENIVVNGTFDDSTGWTLDGSETISDGELHIYAPSGFFVSQAYSDFQLGDKYSVDFDMTTATGQLFKLYFYDIDGFYGLGTIIYPIVGHHNYIIEVGQTGTKGFKFGGDFSVAATIDNFVMKKLIRDIGVHEIQ